MVYEFTDASDSTTHDSGNKESATAKLQQEAYLAMGIAGSAALIYASKGRNDGALAFAANASDDLAMRFMPETAPALKTGLKEFGEKALNKAGSLLEAINPTSVLEQGGKQRLGSWLGDSAEAIGDQAAKGKVAQIIEKASGAAKELPKIEHNYAVGAIPGIQFADGVEDIAPERLSMLRKWVVQGVKMEPDSVDLYLNKNGLDVALKGFPRPSQDLKPMDLLNTQITSIGSSVGSDGQKLTRVSLDMFDGGDSYSLKGTGVQAIQFISKKGW